MYPVSEAFLNAVKANTRKYYWTGRITTRGSVVYNFDQDDMVKGSGYITSQCCGSTEIELGIMSGKATLLQGNNRHRQGNYRQMPVSDTSCRSLRITRRVFL